MATVEQRYQLAIAYVTRAVAAVETPSAWNPIDWYAGRIKIETARNDLRAIEGRWLRARTDDDRALVARDAELLADRTQEVLPGAPQDRQRTNLAKGEHPTFAPATSYAQEVEHQAGEAWSWAKDTASDVTDGIASIGKLVLVGGGLFLGMKLVDFLKSKQRNRRGTPTTKALNRQLQRVANRRRVS
jgi:hypothetical protein